jgi:hypothetical protein
MTPEGDGRYAHLRDEPGKSNTVLGWAVVGDGTLRLETNSVARADRLRDAVRAACGPLTHRGRTHEDPFVLAENLSPDALPEDDELSDEDPDRVILAFKQSHYESWPDEPIPALDDKTPRASVRSKAGRSRVTALINDIEFHESAEPEGVRFDVSVLRRELKLG